MSIELIGILVSGQGVAKHFTRESWARQAFMNAVGIDPFPGTLNMTVAADLVRQNWLDIRGKKGVHLPAPNEKFCDARLFRAVVKEPISGKSADGAVVVPLVPGYPEDQLELIAAIGLREALGVEDGAQLKVLIDIGGTGG